MSPRPVIAAIVAGQLERSTDSFSASISGMVPHCSAMTFLSRPRLTGTGRASSGRQLDRTVPATAFDLQEVQRRHGVV
jgi:hypothetical protein